jgi:hypothetical protein
MVRLLVALAKRWQRSARISLSERARLAPLCIRPTTGDYSMTNLAAEKLAVAQEAARLGVSFTKPNEMVLTTAQFDLFMRGLERAFEAGAIDGDLGEQIVQATTELRERLDRSCVVHQFPRKPKGAS